MKYKINFDPKIGDCIKVIKNRRTKNNCIDNYYYTYTCYAIEKTEIFLEEHFSGPSFSSGNIFTSGCWKEYCCRFNGKFWKQIKK